VERPRANTPGTLPGSGRPASHDPVASIPGQEGRHTVVTDGATRVLRERGSHQEFTSYTAVEVAGIDRVGSFRNGLVGACNRSSWAASCVCLLPRLTAVDPCFCSGVLRRADGDGHHLTKRGWLLSLGGARELVTQLLL
jgi:hypothetical protein